MILAPPFLWPLVRAEWAHHPWRHALAALAVALGVALAWAVHLINASALAEFSAAVRVANGEPDLVVRAAGGVRLGFDDALVDRIAGLPGVEAASPAIEVETYARTAGGRRAVRLIGIDALRIAALAPELLPRPGDATRGERRFAALDPGLVFANAAARRELGLEPNDRIELQAGPAWVAFEAGGDIPAGGPALLVADIAAVQRHFLRGAAHVSRVDLRLAAGADRAALSAALPAGVRATTPDEAQARVSNLSRAYRVNLTVLALVALFVGAFLVYSVISLSVAQRQPGLALLGVLGLTASERARLVLGESVLLGAAGSVLGLGAGTGLAQAALELMAGDLGGGHFPGAPGLVPPLQFDLGAMLIFGALGVAAAAVGAWVPAAQARSIKPALALKGLGQFDAAPAPWWPGPALLALGAALALLPPVGGLPLAAYASVAALLFGGIALVPAAVDAGVRLWRAWRPAHIGLLALLALERAHFHRRTASAAVAGIVASLALGVALTVMVASFRSGVQQWLDQVLPADLYLRTASSSTLAEQAWLDDAFVARAAALPGVDRLQPARQRSLQIEPGQPAVTLVARALGPADAPGATLPLVGPVLPASVDGGVEFFVSEAMVARYGAKPGTRLMLPLPEGRIEGRVRGVVRDYARQFGTVVIDQARYRALTNDLRVNDVAVWLRPGAAIAEVQAGLRAAAPDPAMLEFVGAAELRRISLAIFDRSFAVTRWLQAVAIGIGLVGIAASLSAQVLARRREFGLLAHLGLTRRQTITLVTAETAVWLLAGIAVGLGLGIAVSVVLVQVVNPQSFHWTMPLVVPPLALSALAAAVLAAGLVTAAVTARRAAAHQLVRAVKEDW